jgi:hypothetical protein
MVEKLAERTRLPRASSVKQSSQQKPIKSYKELTNSRLRTIHSIKSLVQEETNSPRPVHPNGAVLVHVRRVVKHSSNVRNDKAESGESDLRSESASHTRTERDASLAKNDTHSIRRHGHGEDVNDLAPPVRLEHIAGEKTVINGCLNVSSNSFNLDPRLPERTHVQA